MVRTAHLLFHQEDGAVVLKTALAQRLIVGEHSSTIDQLLLVYRDACFFLNALFQHLNSIGQFTLHNKVVSVHHLHFQFNIICRHSTALPKQQMKRMEVRGSSRGSIHFQTAGFGINKHFMTLLFLVHLSVVEPLVLQHVVQRLVDDAVQLRHARVAVDLAGADGEEGVLAESDVASIHAFSGHYPWSGLKRRAF